MAQGTLLEFDDTEYDIGSGLHNFTSGTYACRLVTTIPSVTDSTDFTLLTEASGPGYTTGGITLALTHTKTAGGSTLTTTTVPSWAQTAGGASAKAAVIVNTANNRMTHFIDITTDGGGTSVSLNDGLIDITFDASGLRTIA